MTVYAPELLPAPKFQAQSRKPRLGFLGLGWIGRNRMEAIARSGLAEIVALSDVSTEAALKATEITTGAAVAGSLDELLGLGLDGLVIATPSALHAQQAIRALRNGTAVFCQKPLGRNAAETTEVIEAARRNDALLGVDLSYRHVACIRQLHELCRAGDLGDIYSVDLFFHNAYGPDKAWFYDESLSGGGCVIDLGIHLVDLALWNLGFPQVTEVTSSLFSSGRPVTKSAGKVEDYAVASMSLETGATIRLACSWKLPAGCCAIISGSFFGTRGGAAFHNIDGSFYHFIGERYHGTRREPLTCIDEPWGGLAAVRWAEQLAKGQHFDPEVSQLQQVAQILDSIYESA